MICLQFAQSIADVHTYVKTMKKVGLDRGNGLFKTKISYFF